LYATTKKLLDDLNLRSLKELPDLTEMGELIEQPHADVALPENLHATE
jgi:chromosome segregation and condensation protein ScpB